MDNETDDTKVLLINLFLENIYLGVPMRQSGGQEKNFEVTPLFWANVFPGDVCLKCESQKAPLVTY